MVQIAEEWEAMSDGKKLYRKSWAPDDSVATKAILVFLHGFSDHISAYYNFFPTLASPPYNIAVYGFDQRGWGRSVTSPEETGLTGSSTQVMQDVYGMLNNVISSTGQDGLPLFLMGHSMGGQEALQYVLSTSPREHLHGHPLPPLRGLLCESPYVSLDPASQPNGFTVFAGRIAARLMPHKQMLQKLDSTYMSKDPKVRKDWEDDKLCHDTGTLAGLAGMLDRASQLTELSQGKTIPGLNLRVGCPVWIGHGSGDRVTNFDVTKKLFEVLEEKDKTFKEYPGAYHKLHAEPNGVGEQFTKDVGEWILAHAGNATFAAGSPGTSESGHDEVRAKL